MTGTNCGLFTHNYSLSYLNHLVSLHSRNVRLSSLKKKKLSCKIFGIGLKAYVLFLVAQKILTYCLLCLFVHRPMCALHREEFLTETLKQTRTRTVFPCRILALIRHQLTSLESVPFIRILSLTTADTATATCCCRAVLQQHSSDLSEIQDFSRNQLRN
jgi:hypothetical protein